MRPFLQYTYAFNSILKLSFYDNPNFSQTTAQTKLIFYVYQ